MTDDTQSQASRAVPEPTNLSDLGCTPGWDGRSYHIQVGQLDDRWFARAVADDDPFYFFREFDNEDAAWHAAEALFEECTVEPDLRFVVEGSLAPGKPFHVSLTGGGDAWHLNTRCAGDTPRFRCFESSKEAIVELFIALVYCRNQGVRQGGSGNTTRAGATRPSSVACASHPMPAAAGMGLDRQADDRESG
jgi:hypothetical protein